MTKSSGQKLMIGPRLRRLRQTLGLTQARMAQDLDISTSYLNLIERNQRPMSAKVLLRLSGVYDFDMAEFSGRSDAALVADLHDAMRDPAVGAGNVSRQDLEDIVGINPELGQAVLKLYKNYRRVGYRQRGGSPVSAIGQIRNRAVDGADAAPEKRPWPDGTGSAYIRHA